MYEKKVKDRTHPTTTLFEMGNKAIRLDTELHHSSDESNTETFSVQKPAGDQVFGDGLFWETFDGIPG